MSDQKPIPETSKPELSATSTKAEIRAALSAQRHAVDQETRRRAGRTIAEKLTTPPIDILLRAEVICIYLSTPHEIPTHHFARIAWARGKVLCVPVWDKNISQYRLCLFTPETQVVTGKHGIREPVTRIDVPVWDVHAFIMPGLAFDASGGRLGYGGGYYDKLLMKAAPTAMKIGVCYDWQVVNFNLPLDEHDKRVDFLMTERKMIPCSKPKGMRA